MQLSYSKLRTYGECPLRYRFTYLDRLPRRPRRLFRAGRRVHAALMRWLTYARSGQPAWPQVEAAYRQAWETSDGGAPLGERDYEEGLGILRAFHEANVDRPAQPVFLEHRFTIPLGGHTLIGAMDRVDATDAGYEIIDYKLQRDLPTTEEVARDLQLGLYHLALEEAHGVRAEALSLYFLRHNVVRTTRRAPEEARELKRWVVLTGNDIQSDRRWAACKGAHCAGCDFKASCPAHTGLPVPAFTGRVLAPESQLTLLQPEPTPPPAPLAAAAPSRAAGQLALPFAP
jgi:RecB family exonuclease